MIINSMESRNQKPINLTSLDDDIEFIRIGKDKYGIVFPLEVTSQDSCSSQRVKSSTLQKLAGKVMKFLNKKVSF